MRKIPNISHQGAQTVILFGASFAGIALKLENTGSTFSSFDPCPPMPSLARADRKEFQCLLIRQHDLAF